MQQPKADELLFHHRLGQFFFGNLCFQVFLLGFEGFQTLFGGAGQDAGLDGVEHILDAGLGFSELLLVEGQAGALPVLQLHDRCHKGIDDCVVLDQLYGLVDHQVFQPLFANCLFVAGLPLLGGRALVVAMHIAGAAGAAFTEHQCAAVAAE